MSLVDLCVRRPVFATMLIVALVVLGLASYRDLGLDIFPKVDIPTVTVTTRLPGVVEEIRAELAHVVERFQARDAEGVLQHISEEYWTGPLGKRAIRAQLLTLLQVHQQVRARVTLDEVRLVGQHAWVWTSGEITGQLAVVGTWMQLFVWERELEVARREQGVWRLYGYQQ